MPEQAPNRGGRWLAVVSVLGAVGGFARFGLHAAGALFEASAAFATCSPATWS